MPTPDVAYDDTMLIRPIISLSTSSNAKNNEYRSNVNFYDFKSTKFDESGNSKLPGIYEGSRLLTYLDQTTTSVKAGVYSLELCLRLNNADS